MVALGKIVGNLRGVYEGTTTWGTLSAVTGNILEISGLNGLATVGELCKIERTHLPPIRGEIIGLRDKLTIVLTETLPEGLKSGDRVYLENILSVRPSEEWLGKVINAFGQIRTDSQWISAPSGLESYPLRGIPPVGSQRRRIGERLETGSNIFNTFLPLCKGQRVGLFAGSGVGKSTLLARLARHVQTDVVVIGLIGERGREVNEFIEETLGQEGMKRSVVIAATSDESPLIKRRAAFLTMTVAEYFRDQGKQVLVLFDSLTRFAEAQREIGLAAGEPPAMRAFPPSVFSELMTLSERAGPGQKNTQQGDITGIFTVLVQGSDMEEPVADTVRGTLDGHVILEREIAERGRYPAVNILKSISRSLPRCANGTENNALGQARKLISDYTDMAPMIRLGAYKRGSDTQLDQAIRVFPKIEEFISDSALYNVETSFKKLKELLG
jgi:flagellum-specific ATP synthase